MTRYSHVEEEDQNMADLQARGEKIMAPTLEEALEPFAKAEATMTGFDPADGGCYAAHTRNHVSLNDYTRAAQALAAHRERGEADGWVLVPREPTEAMTMAGLQELPFGSGSPAVAAQAYRAMLAAAPIKSGLGTGRHRDRRGAEHRVGVRTGRTPG